MIGLDDDLSELDGLMTADMPPASFAEAYSELQRIAADLKPTPNKIPDVDAIEPLVRRANVLARFCQQRIDSVRSLIEDQQAGIGLT